MFSYLRYFSIVSAVIVTIAAIMLGYYFRNAAGDDLRDLAIKNNLVLAQGFINNTWKNSDMVAMVRLFNKNDIPQEDWHKYRNYKENFEEFRNSVFKYFEEMPVVHVTIYDHNGKAILAINQSKILGNDEIDIKFSDPLETRKNTQEAMDGVTSSKVLLDASFQVADGSRKSGTLVQTAMPILSNDYVSLIAGANKSKSIEGMVEIYYDITRQWQKLDQFQYVGTGTIITIFLLLIIALIVVAKKAESIISKQHETNLGLASQAAAAQAENENKSQFLASISHELRTPLNAIIGFSELIKSEAMGPIKNPQYKDYINDIHNSGVHLLSLINDILDYSKAEAGKLALNIEEVDITKTINSCMRLIAPRAKAAGVILETNVPKDHYTLPTDKKKVKQILLNLLSNAVKFTPDGGVVKVTLWQNVVDSSISFEVADSGIGIAPKDISKALSPFGQVDSALSRKYEGTGLGLPLTKKFIELLGGELELTSEEGKGTTIRFSLPMGQYIENINTNSTDAEPNKSPENDEEQPQETNAISAEEATIANPAAITEVPYQEITAEEVTIANPAAITEPEPIESPISETTAEEVNQAESTLINPLSDEAEEISPELLKDISSLSNATPQAIEPITPLELDAPNLSQEPLQEPAEATDNSEALPVPPSLFTKSDG